MARPKKASTDTAATTAVTSDEKSVLRSLTHSLATELLEVAAPSLAPTSFGDFKRACKVN